MSEYSKDQHRYTLFTGRRVVNLGKGCNFETQLKRMTTRFLMTLMALLVFSSAAQAQEDSWWKKLFKKETVDEMEKTPSEEKEVIDYTQPETETPSVEESKDTITLSKPAVLQQRGDVRITEPKGFASLDSLFRENPPVIEGYRIQIFFGDLQTARGERANFLKRSIDTPCYLVQNPPNFVVQVGNYRTQLEAHRYLNELKEIYPSARIIPTEIQPFDKKD